MASEDESSPSSIRLVRRCGDGPVVDAFDVPSSLLKTFSGGTLETMCVEETNGPASRPIVDITELLLLVGDGGVDDSALQPSTLFRLLRSWFDMIGTYPHDPAPVAAPRRVFVGSLSDIIRGAFLERPQTASFFQLAVSDCLRPPAAAAAAVEKETAVPRGDELTSSTTTMHAVLHRLVTIHAIGEVLGLDRLRADAAKLVAVLLRSWCGSDASGLRPATGGEDTGEAAQMRAWLAEVVEGLDV